MEVRLPLKCRVYVFDALIYVGVSDAGALIRCLPGDDRTNGFFVSCFVRNGEQKALPVPDATPSSSKRSIEGVEQTVPTGSRNKKKRRKR